MPITRRHAARVGHVSPVTHICHRNIRRCVYPHPLHDGMGIVRYSNGHASHHINAHSTRCLPLYTHQQRRGNTHSTAARAACARRPHHQQQQRTMVFHPIIAPPCRKPSSRNSQLRHPASVESLVIDYSPNTQHVHPHPSHRSCEHSPPPPSYDPPCDDVMLHSGPYHPASRVTLRCVMRIRRRCSAVRMLRNYA